MFFIFFRILLMVVSILVIGYFLFKWIKRVYLVDERREKLEEALMNIEETIKESETVPEVNTDRLHKAHKHIKDILKKGKKEGRTK